MVVLLWTNWFTQKTTQSSNKTISLAGIHRRQMVRNSWNCQGLLIFTLLEVAEFHPWVQSTPFELSQLSSEKIHPALRMRVYQIVNLDYPSRTPSPKVLCLFVLTTCSNLFTTGCLSQITSRFLPNLVNRVDWSNVECVGESSSVTCGTQTGIIDAVWELFILATGIISVLLVAIVRQESQGWEHQAREPVSERCAAAFSAQVTGCWQPHCHRQQTSASCNSASRICDGCGQWFL